MLYTYMNPEKRKHSKTAVCKLKILIKEIMNCNIVCVSVRAWVGEGVRVRESE
jgi:hypothetical protein